ncbi:MAG: YraN family protein [Phycisphaerae bacterium]
MSDPRASFALEGERLAEQFLRARGLRVAARRFSTPVGELDLVMRAGRTIVFVEVKTRRDRRLADPHDAVTPAKQRRLLRAAAWYLHFNKLENRPCRFDIVSIVLPSDEPPEIEHFEDAFRPVR